VIPLQERPVDRRKLAAILAADVAGYSILMADDEAATVRSLNDVREVCRKRIEGRGGRVIDTAGDSVLAEFPSAVEAVDCSVEIQHELQKRNTQLAEHRRMQLRIGINLGDVIELEDGTIYGDGVNVAARLQALAENGGICISGTAYDQVEGKLRLQFNFIGEQQVKNIPKPVRAYKIQTEDNYVTNMSSTISRRRPIVIAVGMLIMGCLALAIVKIQQPEVKPAQLNDTAFAMPTGPSIAVLPFTNMSEDSTEDYFSDGLTEDIITELARVRELHVLARNTTFQYKGHAVDVQLLGRKLGVQYVMEGSVRREKERVRITAQLIDATTGAHIWAERFDRKLKDIFAVQDEITTRIVSAIAAGSAGLVQESARRSVAGKKPENMEAYELVLRATAPHPYTQQWYDDTSALLERAIHVEPNYARARQEFAWLKLLGWIFRFDKSTLPPDDIKHNAIKAVELDPNDALAHRTAAYGYFFDHQLESFERESQLALALTPYDADVLTELGMAYSMIGKWDLGTRLVKKAYQLNPLSAGGWYHSALHYNYYREGNYRLALEMARGHPGQAMCETQFKYIAAYGQLHEPEKANEHWNNCVKSVSDFSTERVAEIMRIWNFQEPFIEHYMEGMRKAGYPCRNPDCKLSR
jgi:adenylate cyclase